MEQIAVNFTNEGSPALWLTPTVKIRDKSGEQIIENWPLAEIAGGWYIYNFYQYNPDHTYLYLFDWWEWLSNFERYKYGGNDLDAYANKYSWWRTAAPFMNNVTGSFWKVDKLLNKIDKKKYDDSELKQGIREVKDILNARGWYDVYDKLSELNWLISKIGETLGVVSSSVEDWNASENFSSLNEKLDLVAEYVVKMKENIDNTLTTMDEEIANRILESNSALTDSFNNWMSDKVNIDQLLQQSERIEGKLNEVVDSVVSKRLSDELADKYNVNVSRKPVMNDEEAMNSMQGMTDADFMNLMWQWMEQWVNAPSAPVDMQWIAEPTMPNAY